MPYSPSEADIRQVYEITEQIRAADSIEGASAAFTHLVEMLQSAGFIPSSRRSKGRAVEELPTYTFKNGAIAAVHHIGQMTVAHIAAGVEKKTPAVPIPTFEVDMGGGIKSQPNPADPAYQAAVEERRGRVNLAVMDTLLDLALDIEIDQAELDRLKASMERIGLPLDEPSDKAAYIKHCCVSNTNELGKLSNLIAGNLDEAAEAATTTFPSDLPGSTAEPLESAPLRRPVLA